VKPSVTVDFLRGILSAYAAYSCYFFSDLFWFICFRGSKRLKQEHQPWRLPSHYSLLSLVVSASALGQNGIHRHLPFLPSAGWLSGVLAKLSSECLFFSPTLDEPALALARDIHSRS
jgi:hypothetical protein